MFDFFADLCGTILDAFSGIFDWLADMAPYVAMAAAVALCVAFPAAIPVLAGTVFASLTGPVAALLLLGTTALLLPEESAAAVGAVTDAAVTIAEPVLDSVTNVTGHFLSKPLVWIIGGLGLLLLLSANTASES